MHMFKKACQRAAKGLSSIAWTRHHTLARGLKATNRLLLPAPATKLEPPTEGTAPELDMLHPRRLAFVFTRFRPYRIAGSRVAGQQTKSTRSGLNTLHAGRVSNFTEPRARFPIHRVDQDRYALRRPRKASPRVRCRTAAEMLLRSSFRPAQ